MFMIEFYSAEDAKKMTRKSIDCIVFDELLHIFQLIRSSIEHGCYEVTCAGTINDETVYRLIGLGYKVDATSDDPYSYRISWDEVEVYDV